MKRRNFLRSIIAAVALSPLMVRAKDAPLVELGRYHVRIEADGVIVADYFTNDRHMPPSVPHVYQTSCSMRDLKPEDESWIEQSNSTWTARDITIS